MKTEKLSMSEGLNFVDRSMTHEEIADAKTQSCRSFFFARLYGVRRKVYCPGCLWIWVDKEDLLALTNEQRAASKWHLGQNVLATSDNAYDWAVENGLKNSMLDMALERLSAMPAFTAKPKKVTEYA